MLIEAVRACRSCSLFAILSVPILIQATATLIQGVAPSQDEVSVSVLIQARATDPSRSHRSQDAELLILLISNQLFHSSRAIGVKFTSHFVEISKNKSKCPEILLACSKLKWNGATGDHIELNAFELLDLEAQEGFADAVAAAAASAWANSAALGGET
ncbi:uncharacterized protein F5891DRAFT_1194734 [Suillus fuscotomentosus]|uniref:Uncharacterized protein n=1 Tax=Suillus fuscotomentosus TaxID=1912939 RepID=A0AAD4DVN2_9AGAM|nr:uncharacterized protein F5891DRAFT_1194734 [Suillus fuscotomentosus]KAG1894925.1 hypothetical protein F5891DRAFT_1194734 [Suillus fuscotomentosus]